MTAKIIGKVKSSVWLFSCDGLGVKVGSNVGSGVGDGLANGIGVIVAVGEGGFEENVGR